MLIAKRKDVRAVKDGKTLLLRDDYTGTVEAVNLPLLTQFIGPGRVPVGPLPRRRREATTVGRCRQDFSCGTTPQAQSSVVFARLRTSIL